jgi:hypothetical protein
MKGDFVVIRNVNVTGVFESKVNDSLLSKLKFAMTQKEILRKLIGLLSGELRIFDFEPSYKEQGFIRKTNTAIYLYQFLVYNRTNIKTYKRGFLIEPYIWINVLEIEKYYREITLNKIIKSDTDFKTIGNSLADILANPDGFFKNRNQSLDLFVFDEKHIDFVAAELLRRFKEVALPYCINNGNVKTVDALINTRPNEYKVHTPNDNQRIIKGIIAAKLNGNPALTELVRIYDRQLVERDMQAKTKEEMIRLKNLLSI